MKILRLRRLAAGAALLVLASGCSRYGFDGQELGLRHDPQRDTLEVVLVSRGLFGTGSGSGQQAAQDAAGARHVILGDWPLDFDFEEFEEQLGSHDHPLAPRALAFVQGIEVKESGTWVEEDGRLSLYQRLSVPRASEGLALLSELINSESQGSDAGAEAAADTAEVFGAPTGELFGAHVRAGRSWAALEQGSFVVRIPMSADGAARALEATLETSQDDGPVMPLARALSALTQEDGVLTLTWSPDASGWIRLQLERERGEDQPRLAAPDAPAPLLAPPEWVASFLRPVAAAGSEKR